MFACFFCHSVSDPKHPDPSRSNRIDGLNPIARLGLVLETPFLGTYKHIVRVKYWKTNQDVLGEIA